MKRNISSAQLEAILFAVLFLIVLVCAVQTDLFEKVVTYYGANDRYELDELIFVGALFSVFSMLYAMRRWLELHRLMAVQQESACALENSNRQLSEIADKLYRKQAVNAQLVRLVNYLQACKDKEEAFRFIGDAAGKLFEDFTGEIFIIRESRNQLVKVASWGDSEVVECFAPDDCWGLRMGKCFVSVPGLVNNVCRHVREADTDGISACYPLLAYGETIGLVHVDMPVQCWDETTRAIREEFEQPLALFAEQVSLSISNIQLQQKMRYMAIHDQLTGLYNRHYMSEIFEKEIRRAARREGELGIVMMDIDHFKTLNDTFGHAAGDVVLAEVGKFLRGFFRSEDYCCRYGGEEFFVLIADIERDTFIERCELLRRGIEGLSVSLQNASLPNVTATIGCAVYPDHGERSAELIEAADKALYLGKKTGRNRVQLAPLPAES